MPIPITHFRTSHPGEDERVDAGWRRHFPTLTVELIGGDHFTMFDPPHLTDLCTRFRATCVGMSDDDSSGRRQTKRDRRAS